MNQTQTLNNFEKLLGVGPVDASRLLNTNYNTYKAWKSERNTMPGVAHIAISYLILHHLEERKK